jgi:uncharacterized RDD family membrane protein YckC
MASERGLLEGNHTVLTPEYVEFDFVLAGLYSRMLALLLDTLVSGVIKTAAIFALSLTAIWAGGFGIALVFIANFLIDVGYGITMETWWSGQTVGKRALGLRVLQENGVRIDFYRAVLRNLIRPFDSLIVLYMVGGVAALFSKSGQRFGDMLAGTIVVRERRLKIPASIARPEEELHLLSDALFQSRVAKLSAEEQELIFAAAIRREELGMEARLKLFAALSERLQSDADISKPAHLSDEKLVLLVAAAVAAQKKAAQGTRPRLAKRAAA